MERLNNNQFVNSVLKALDDTVNTFTEEHFFSGRKVSINHDVVRSICIGNQHLSFTEQVKALFDVAINSNFSPALDDKPAIKNFNTWFWGLYCPVEDEKLSFNCLCRKVHQQFPKQKVGGILTENERRIVKGGSPDAPELNPDALLALSACRLIESERFLKMHEQQLKKASAETSSIFLEKASSKRKDAYVHLTIANILDGEQTGKQLRSWLIQSALNNGTISRASDVEKIKQFRSGQQKRLSDQWFKLLIDSGLYPNTEPLASPMAITQRLADIASQFIKLNNCYPYSSLDSPVLLFSRHELLIKSLRIMPGYLPEPADEYEVLYRALHIAIFADEARITHQLATMSEALAGKSPANLPTSTPARKLTSTVTHRAHLRWLKDETPVSQAVFVRTKKTGQAASAATTWIKGQTPFPKPENLVTAFAYIFNVMTYQDPNDKTRIYNMPQHHQRIKDAFQLLNQAVSSEPSLPDNLHGYACFLTGWLHEQKLINSPSHEKAATWYEQAASRGKFIPLNLKAGDLFAEIGDYRNACRCYEQMHQQLQTLMGSTGEDPTTADSGYLSPSFQTFLESKIEYARIKAKDTSYLRGLTPEEIQQYINGDKDNSRGTPSRKQKNSLTGNQGREPAWSESPCQPEYPPDGDGLFQDKGPDSDTDNAVSNTLSTPATEQTPGSSSDRTRQPADGQDTARQPASITVNPASRNERSANLPGIVRNRLTSQWDCSVRSLLKQFFNRKEQLIHTHEEQIAWLTPKLDKIHRKLGSEVLMEHLAWEHIGAAEQPLLRDIGHRQESTVKTCVAHLNQARDLLLQSMIRKTGIPYPQLPDPKTFEVDVLNIVEQVTPSLTPIEITEWLFGIVCQARSLGHVFSTFRLLYPRSKNIAYLNRGWFSLKRLYRTPWEAVRE